MTEKKEIKLNKGKIKNNFKLVILSSILSFFLLLIIALSGKISPSNPQNRYSSDICYYGILSKDGYCNINNDNTGNSIQVYYGYTFDDDEVPSEKKTWHQPKENERWSIPQTFFTSERKDAEITFKDKFFVIYLPLILSKNIFIWILFSVIIFFTIKLKNKYLFKFE